MIRFIAGKPRGGKSLRAVQFLIEELKTTKRNIVTNLPLKLDALQEYLEEQDAKVFVFDRVRILTADETDEFYRYRGRDSKGNDYVMGLRYGPDGKPDNKLPLDIEPLRLDDRLTLGVAYYIDEIHIHFNSRKWTTVAEVALWYASQHAKLGDDVWCVTQSVSNVVKQFRDLAQEFRYVRNLRKEKFSVFKVGNKFVERVHLEMVNPGTDREPMETNSYTLDVAGIASCYDTSAGVGVAGNGDADKGKDAKGFPLWLMWVGFAAVFAFFWWGAGHLPRLLNRGLSAAAGIKPSRQMTQASVPVSANLTPPALTQTAQVLTPPASSSVSATSEIEFYSGIMIKGRTRYLVTEGGLVRVLESHFGGKYVGEDGIRYRRVCLRVAEPKNE